jgi:membrane glycosyltransferase
VTCEAIFSVLFAPISMAMQSRFVFDVLRGRRSGWHASERDARSISLREAVTAHRGHTIAGLLLGCGSYLYLPSLCRSCDLHPACVARVLRRIGRENETHGPSVDG